MDREKLLQTVLDCGATKAEYLTGDQIVTSAHFREICRSNACGGYGRCWVCPPDNGNIEELMAKVKSYPYALLYQLIGEIEDSYDYEGMTEVGTQHKRLSQKIRQALLPWMDVDYLHLSSGGCNLCAKCARLTNEPCRHPQEALSSLEGYGIDVYHTTSHTQLKYINGQNTVTYFGLILFAE